MLGGKNKHLSLGYTIVEVMIVLAVSGLMFVIAANFINGKQQKTAFQQGVNEMASRIQAMIEQVSDGQYSDIPFTCSASSTPLQISASATQKQGTNSGCVFIGKFLQFYNQNNPSSYATFSLAAARTSTALGPDVTPVYSQLDSGASVDLTTQQNIPQQLSVTATRVTVVDTNDVTRAFNYGFGFTQSQGTVGEEAGTYTSGAQTVNLAYSPNFNSPAQVSSEATAITALTSHVALAKSASFCLTDGTYYAQISVGGNNSNGNQLGVRVKMNGKTAC